MFTSPGSRTGFSPGHAGEFALHLIVHALDALAGGPQPALRHHLGQRVALRGHQASQAAGSAEARQADLDRPGRAGGAEFGIGIHPHAPGHELGGNNPETRSSRIWLPSCSPTGSPASLAPWAPVPTTSRPPDSASDCNDYLQVVGLPALRAALDRQIQADNASGECYNEDVA